MSLATIIAEIEGTSQVTESDILGFIADIKQGIEVALEDLEAGLQYLATAAPTIVADLQEALGFATTLQAAGITIPAAVLSAANAAVAGLNSIQTEQAAGADAGTVLTSAFVAVKAASAAQANAALAVATAPTVAPKAAA